MPMTMHSDLEKALNSLAGTRGLPTVHAVLNRLGARGKEPCKVLPFPSEPKLWWIEK